MKTAAQDAIRTAAGFSDDALLALMKYLKGSKQPQSTNRDVQPNPPLIGPGIQLPGAPKFGAAFELAYIPAFIKAANARGVYFKDLEDLGRALIKVAARRSQKVASVKTGARIINADVGLMDIVEHMRAAKEAKAKAERLKTMPAAPMGSSGGGAV